MSESSPIKVLVVDDEKIVRDFLSRLLSLKGIRVKAVEDGFQAIEKAKKEKFDMVLLDVRMPKMDGVETLKKLKKLNPGTKYVMMTGYSVDVLLAQAKKEGASASFKKPFDINQVTSLLEDYIQKKRPGERLSILVVDDDEVILNFFNRLLDSNIYDVTTVKTGREALANIKQRDFDLTFLDIILKDINGLDLYAKIQEIKPKLNIVFITGSPEAKDKIEHLYIRRCLYKPFEIDKIFTEIDRVRKSKGI
jgi:DNA-binding NtrC family response regulator